MASFDPVEPQQLFALSKAMRRGLTAEADPVNPSAHLFDALPVAVYLTDAEGRITYYNKAAARLWGRRPKLGEDGWCGSHLLRWPDGAPMAHDECPMAIALKEGRALSGREAAAERPDGTRIAFLAYPTPLFDDEGELAGAINALVDISAHKTLEEQARRSAAIVDCVEDAIYTVGADGCVASWNRGAERLYGYAAEEIVGRPLALLIPPERAGEDRMLAERLRRDGRVVHFETVCRRKNGELVEIAFNITPLTDAKGDIAGAVRVARDISPLKAAESRLRESERRFRGIFETARVSIWEEDFTRVLDFIEALPVRTEAELRAYLHEEPERVREAVRMMRVLDVNDYTLELFEASDRKELLASAEKLFLPETLQVFLEELVTLWKGERRMEREIAVKTLGGRRMDVAFSITFTGERGGHALVTIADITAVKASERAARVETSRFETLNAVAQAISADLDLESVVQKVTDAARHLSGAKFGAFFYNTTNEDGDAFMLYTLSGAPRAAFEKFGVPRVTRLFEATFKGEGVVRSDDIRKDPRYGQNPPHRGMPEGHLPVVSYLAAPVISRSGEVIGALLFGHDQPGVFTQESESLVAGIASHAAIAIDNARLHEAAQREIAQRREAEAAKELLLKELQHRVGNTLATVQAIARQSFAGADPEDSAAFSGRLRALARANDVLLARGANEAPLTAIVENALAPFGAADRLSIAGDDAVLGAKPAATLAMALHELATNAVKYGALSNQAGRVELRWRTDDAGERRMLILTWRERGGPPVTPPTRTGFGAKLLAQAFGETGEADLSFAPEGVVCTLKVALAAPAQAS